MAAFGTTTREEQFSISAKIWIDSPETKQNFTFSLHLQGSLKQIATFCYNALDAASNALPSQTSTDTNRNRPTMSKSKRKMYRSQKQLSFNNVETQLALVNKISHS